MSLCSQNMGPQSSPVHKKPDSPSTWCAKTQLRVEGLGVLRFRGLGV